MLVTKTMLDKAQTKNGAYTGLQLEMVNTLVGMKKGWPKRLMCTEVTLEWWNRFYRARLVFKGKKTSGQLINSMSTNRDSSWNPKPQDIPPLRRKGDGKGVDNCGLTQVFDYALKLADYLDRTGVVGFHDLKKGLKEFNSSPSITFDIDQANINQ